MKTLLTRTSTQLFFGSNGQRRRGAIMVLVALLMVMFIGAVAFSVDVAYMELTRTELRVATDAAARAGGEALTREQNLNLAIQAAKDMGAANLVAGDPLLLADEDILTGNSVLQNDGTWTFTPDGTPINAIRVLGRRTNDSLSGSVPLFFGKIFNVLDFEPSLSSTVIRTDRDICLVLDRSSSMKLDLASPAETMGLGDPRICRIPDRVDSRWAALANAVQAFTDELSATPQTEFVSLVSFASAFTRCGVSNTDSEVNRAMTGDHTLVNQSMQTLSNTVFNGGTNIAAGIDRGVVVLTDANSIRPFAFKTMILFTDGHATQGRRPRLAAQDAAWANITIHTITFGNGANQPDMQEVAEITGGTHYHAPDAAALEKIFREIALTVSVTFTE